MKHSKLAGRRRGVVVDARGASAGRHGALAAHRTEPRRRRVLRRRGASASRPPTRAPRSRCSTSRTSRYKKKLTTLLQSPERPNIIYSWGGGVLREQVKAGVIEDITAPIERRLARPLHAGGAAASTRSTTRSTACRCRPRRSASSTTRTCSPRPASTRNAIKTWDDLLAAVKKLQAAGITPHHRRRRRQVAAALLLVAPGHPHRRQAGLRRRAARRGQGLRRRDLRARRRAVQAAGRPEALPGRLPRRDLSAVGRPVRRRQGRDDADAQRPARTR